MHNLTDPELLALETALSVSDEFLQIALDEEDYEALDGVWRELRNELKQRNLNENN